MTPVWLDRTEYPFTLRFLTLNDGTIHYIDEGEGERIILMVHGTPVWSFVYRHLIRELSPRYRCIALDHLGFGLSDKPAAADYSPQAHARRLGEFVQAIGINRCIVFAQDYGGPIALDFAMNNPDLASKIILSNTWLWLLPHLQRGGRLFNNAVGKWLYLWYGFSVKFMIPNAFGNRKNLTPEIHNHYLAPLDTPEKRRATFALVQAFCHDAEWYQSLEKRSDCIRHKPTLMIWGLADRFVPASLFLPLWKTFWLDAEFVELPQVGHFVEEEAPDEVCRAISKFLAVEPG